jgi:hypothetical protein
LKLPLVSRKGLTVEQQIFSLDFGTRFERWETPATRDNQIPPMIELDPR